uniref:Uncharacterized protein n=1 Tax=Anguilla anguilla TaxID=7936 RepID=A0A0E9TDC0_ANGAN
MSAVLLRALLYRVRLIFSLINPFPLYPPCV